MTEVHKRLGADVGYIGSKTDPEPNEVYTIAGQVGASANPEEWAPPADEGDESDADESPAGDESNADDEN